MPRLADLQQVREDLLARMASCSSDQNFAVMGRLLVDVVKQIDELDPEAAEGPTRETGLSDFEKRLREREAQSAKGSARSKSV